MNENRIITYISIWGTLIMAMLLTNTILITIMIVQSILLLIYYTYLKFKD